MANSRRIFLNIIATYGRSVYGVILGLFCGRWLLRSLGHSDYGLIGVVGAMAVFITYVNGIFAWSFNRFFAMSIGKERTNYSLGLDECRMWFSIALALQIIMPTILVLGGYPIGKWAVFNFLSIPFDRLDSCLWIWRFVCFSTFVGMLTIPVNAMYVAHQYIAELTIYSFVASTVNGFFLYYMLQHPGDWLKRYGCWQCFLSVVPNIIIFVRGFYLFPECRFAWRHLRKMRFIFEFCRFTLWNAWGALGVVLRGQGIAILVNKYFGVNVNAGFSVGNNLSSHCSSLSASMVGAFSPAIYESWGAKDFHVAKTLAFRACKLGALLVLIFALPMSVEMRSILKLWLVNPPQYAAEMCIFALIGLIMDKLTVGHMICINANGRITMYQIFLGSIVVSTLPIAWFAVYCGHGPVSVGCVIAIMMALCSFGRVFMARRLVALSITYWIRKILLPILLVVLVCLPIGFIPRLFLGESYLRIISTTFLVELSMSLMMWYVVLEKEEVNFFKCKIARAFGRLET